MVTTAAVRRANLQSNHHHQKTNTQLFTGWMPFLSPKKQRQSTEWNQAHRLPFLMTRKLQLMQFKWSTAAGNRVPLSSASALLLQQLPAITVFSSRAFPVTESSGWNSLNIHTLVLFQSRHLVCGIL